MKKNSKLWAVIALSLPLLLSGCTASSASDQVQGQISAPAPTPSAFTSSPALTVFIPDVEGLTVKEVKPVLSKLGLEAKWDHEVADPSKWVVTGIAPEMGKEVDKGSTVTVQVITAAAYQKQNDPSSSDTASSSATPSSAPTSSASTETGTTPLGTSSSTANSGSSAAAPSISTSVYYPNCAAVIKAGKAPLSSTDPGYRAGLDRDNDGTACDQ